VEQAGGGKTTGRWLSLQIKSGGSYFKETTEEGVVFRDTADHLEYYRQHQLPVVVVLHNPQTDEAIWQAVRPHAVETAKGWKLLVPFAQKLDDRTAAEWGRLLSGRARPSALKSEVRIVDGSLATIHDILGAAEAELLVASPYISITFLALLEFIASRIRVRVVTSEAALEDPLLRERRPSSHLALRVMPRLHSRFLIVDEAALCNVSATFTQRGLSAEREVLAIDTSNTRVRAAVAQFEELWQHAFSESDFGFDSGGVEQPPYFQR
jgi:hypothetical protein